MADKEVKYKISLEGHEQVAGGLDHAEHAAKGFESSMEHVVERITEFAAVYASVDFFKDAYKDFQAFNQASLALGNTLDNVGARAGLGKDELIEMASKGQEATEFTKQQYVEAETALVRFRGLNKDTFEETLKYSADIAQSTHQDVNTVAQSLGQIISQPGEAGRRLRQFGIILTQEQQKWLRAQEASHHLGVAQDFIFKQLADHGYAGAAAIAAMNDPTHQITVGMSELKEELGEGITEAVKEITPFLMQVIGDFRELVHWVKENGHEVKEIAEAVGVAVVAFKLLNLTVVPLMEALEAAPALEAEAAEGMEAVGVAANVAMGPIGLLALAIGAVVMAYESMADASAAVAKNRQDLLNKAGSDETGVLDGMVESLVKKGEKMDAAIALSKKLELKNIHDTEADYEEQYAQPGLSIAENDRIKQQQNILASQKDAVNNYTGDKMKSRAMGMAPIASGTETQKAEGPKVTNINVHIDNLINDFKVQTTTLQGSSQQIKQAVAAALVDAVNDAEVLVGQEH